MFQVDFGISKLGQFLERLNGRYILIILHLEDQTVINPCKLCTMYIFRYFFGGVIF
jgi:hypothetical protein